MSTEPGRSSRSERFRSAIAGFIDGRRTTKLKGKDNDAETASKYDYATWLADAARRVSQIQAVTHVLKATHPDARGSSLHVVPKQLPQHAEIGTHVLGEQFAEDVVGNAAALDVFKLLKLEVDGRKLLDWVLAGDTDLRDALHADSDTATGWMQAFGSLVRQTTTVTSHQAAKQVYWLIGDEPADDESYHLLQPMFSSSLAHAVHADIQDARFGEINKQARQAFKARDPHDGAYRDYRGLVARKLGGTKPQNVSQLNSERGGINYLLASLPPPEWERDRPRNLLGLDSAITRFAHFPGVRELVNALAKHLLAVPDPNAATRDKRGAIEQALGMQLSLFAAEIHARFEPGWTRDPQCKLPTCEQVWLDPERLDTPCPAGSEHDDQVFRDASEFADWPNQVAERFANWVNEQLREAGLTTVGDVEFKHWAKQAIVDAASCMPMHRRARSDR